ILTSRDNADLELQKAGHADLVETQDGEWYMVYLCARPLTKKGCCPLGRETSIQKAVWKDDDWLYLEPGGNQPVLSLPAPGLPEHTWAKESERDDFDSAELS